MGGGLSHPSHSPAANRLRAVCVRALDVERVDVDVRVVYDLEGRKSQWLCATTTTTDSITATTAQWLVVLGRLRGREGQLLGLDGRVRAEAQRGGAEQARGARARCHNPEGPGGDRALPRDGALTDVVVLDLLCL